jgi:hypothetical protein
MHFVLMIAGVLSLVVGLLTVGIGVPERAFSVGAVLMTCGTMATIGGVILVGLASILRQLRRLIDVLEARPVADLTPADIPAREPQLTPVSGSLSAPAATPAGSQRSELSLSPLAANTRQPRPETDEKTRSTAPEIRSPALGAGDDAALAPEIVVINRDAFSPEEATPLKAPSGSNEPVSERSTQKGEMEAPAVPSGETKKREPMFRAGARARAELGLPEKPDGGKAKPSSDERPAVLKSGVIEGMAYTLYADGSIDAEIAGGTVKFNSIPDLREYLGHSGRAP